jgi:hypothetical protein
MRTHGRMLYPSTLSERRLLLQLGGTPALRIPRGLNPFLIARKLARAARFEHPDLLFVRERLARKHKPVPQPRPGPEHEAPVQNPGVPLAVVSVSAGTSNAERAA